MKDMYDDKDLQRIYDEEYFSTRSRPPMWIRRAEFIIEKFNPKTVPKQRVPMAAQGFINEYFTPIHSLINRNEEVGKLFDAVYKKKTKSAQVKSSLIFAGVGSKEYSNISFTYDLLNSAVSFSSCL